MYFTQVETGIIVHFAKVKMDAVGDVLNINGLNVFGIDREP